VKKFIIISSFLLPVASFAAAPATGMTEVNKLVNNISKFILMPVIYAMFAIASLVFVWGVQNFVGKADNPEARSKGAQQMIWGILGMVIMISAIALKTIIEGTVGIL